MAIQGDQQHQDWKLVAGAFIEPGVQRSVLQSWLRSHCLCFLAPPLKKQTADSIGLTGAALSLID